MTLLDEANRERRRLLCGFDFPFGYPEGTARTLTSQDDPNWEHVWNLIEEEITDCDNNNNCRFDAAARLNGRFNGDGPFWGNGLKRDIHCLPRKKPRAGWGENLPPNRRHVEREVRRAQEVWKLSGKGSVGSQALTGIARLNPLRDRGDVQIWPFQTLGEGRCHVLAEIYPSLIEPEPGNGVLDARQVQAVAARLQRLDAARTLADRLHAPEHMPDAVRNEEALFLNITWAD